MKRGNLLSGLVAGVILVAASTPTAQRRDIDQQRQRWEQKTDAEREVLKQRFRELQELSPEDRRRLMERARRIEGIQKSLRATAPEALKKEIDALDPDRRERRWREHTFQRSRELGRHLRESMPAEFRRKLEAAPPEERQQLFEHFMRNSEELSRRAIHGMGRGLGLSRDEIRRLESLPLEERFRAVMKLRRQMLVKRIERYGLPPGLD